MSSFEESLRDRLRAVVAHGTVHRSEAPDHERMLWLKSQAATPPLALPSERADGTPTPGSFRDLLVIDSTEVPTESASVGPGPLVCPLDLRARSAAALVGFLSTSAPALWAEVLSETPERVRARAAGVLAALPGGAVHVVSTTWTVPLPWFALVDPAHRQVVLATQNDPRRQVYWRVAMGDARRRVERAHTLSSDTFGDAGPTKVLQDTARWLDNFDERSAVELDYGGLVQLLDDEELMGDTSAEDVNAILDALESSDAGEVAERFGRLRDFWAQLAIHERFN